MICIKHCLIQIMQFLFSYAKFHVLLCKTSIRQLQLLKNAAHCSTVEFSDLCAGSLCVKNNWGWDTTVGLQSTEWFRVTFLLHPHLSQTVLDRSAYCPWDQKWTEKQHSVSMTTYLEETLPRKLSFKSRHKAFMCATTFSKIKSGSIKSCTTL